MKNKNFFNKFKKYRNINYVIARWKKVHTIAAFFIIFCLFIVEKLFSYTVINYDFYTKLADWQQIWKVTVPVNRWTVYSWWERETVFWTSLNLYDIAVDPQITWDKQKLWEFLVEIVYNELCLAKTKSKCEANLTKFLKVLEIEDFINDEQFIKELIRDRLITKLVQTKVTSVFIDKELDSEQISKIKISWFKWVYVKGNFIYINPEEFSNVDRNIKDLSKIVWTNEERLKYLTRKRELRYIPILNRLSINTSEYVKDYIKWENEALRKWILEDEKSIWWFFILTPNPNRYYPENNVASQVIWFVDNQWVWHYWIEWQFNEILRWNNWQIVSTKDIKWRIIDPISLNKDNLIWEWVEIVSTIDRNIQKKVEDILEKWVKQYRANKWTVVILEPKTWNVIAMANYPTYDLNNYWDVYELEKVKYSKYPDPKIDLLWMPVFIEDSENGEKFYYDNKEIYLRKADREELWNVALVKYKYKNDFWAQVYKNDAISALYEPGSIMKSITVAIWIDTWEVDKYSMYMDKWFVDVGDFTIKNVSDKCLWYHSFWHALNYSCNVWMIRIVQRVWKVLLHQYFEDFWFSQVTGIDLQWEVFSQISPWEKWPLSQLLTNSYWLWISVTPLQMAWAYNVLANWWVYVKPKVIEEIRYSDGRVVNFKPETQRRVIKDSTSKLITEMLLDSTVNWVAKTWAVEWYSLAWKTGTAQINYKWRYETWVWSTIGSYAWFWPIEDPKFTIIVKLDRPRTSQYWGATSAFIFKDIATYLFDYYEIPKKEIKQ